MRNLTPGGSRQPRGTTIRERQFQETDRRRRSAWGPAGGHGWSTKGGVALARQMAEPPKPEAEPPPVIVPLFGTPPPHHENQGCG